MGWELKTSCRYNGAVMMDDSFRGKNVRNFPIDLKSNLEI